MRPERAFNLVEHDRQERISARLQALDAFGMMLGYALNERTELSHWSYGVEQLLRDQVELLRRDLA